MFQKKLNVEQKGEGATLAVLLQALGHQPLGQTGTELFYHSVLNDIDEQASFTVNQQLNVWYDRRTGTGGNIIDFAMAYWKLSLCEAYTKLVGYFPGGELSGCKPLKTRRRHAQKIPYYRIEHITSLGNNAEITDYLVKMHIWESAQNLLSEIYYFVEDEKGARKYFFAPGWQNELGAWEVQGPRFRGCIGHRGITFIGRDCSSLAVFDGCFDYLSWKIDYPSATQSILVINSENLLEAALRKAKSFRKINLFLSRTEPGLQRSVSFLSAFPDAVDRSATYSGYSGYNDMAVRR